MCGSMLFLFLFPPACRWPEDELLAAWKERAPFGLEPDMSMLQGVAVPLPDTVYSRQGSTASVGHTQGSLAATPQKTTVWQHFPKHALPTGNHRQRFREMFKVKPRWPTDLIVPYITDVSMCVCVCVHVCLSVVRSKTLYCVHKPHICFSLTHTCNTHTRTGAGSQPDGGRLPPQVRACRQGHQPRGEAGRGDVYGTLAAIVVSLSHTHRQLKLKGVKSRMHFIMGWVQASRARQRVSSSSAGTAGTSGWRCGRSWAAARGGNPGHHRPSCR
jgi:hypothetical protein